MTLPLMALAVGAIVAGFVSIPPALGGGAALEHFLAPSFTGAAVAHAEAATGSGSSQTPPNVVSQSQPSTQVGSGLSRTEAADAAHEEPHISRGAEIGLMVFSVLVAIAGIYAAYRLYIARPQVADDLKERYAGAHSVLYNKYYVDELYDATFVQGTMKSSSGLWTFDRRVVDGVVNGSGWATVFASWISGLLDRHVVDGAVNLVGRSSQESSFVFRRVQTGLIQNYALLMLAGVFAFVSLYLLVR